MKRIVCLLAVLWVCVGLCACQSKPTEEPLPEEPPMTTEYDEAINTYLSLLWKADPTAMDAAAPSMMYDWLLSQGYGDKEAIKAYVAQEQTNIQVNHYEEEIASFTFELVEWEEYSAENTDTVKQKLSLDYGIAKESVTAAYTALLDSLGTGVSGNVYAQDAVGITIVQINGTYYIVEALDLVNDYAYQLWLT